MKLSVITININNKAGLTKTIDSVINQTFKNFEYIVIDGNSTDGSLDIIKANSSNINFWISEPDSGIYNAMNKGIKNANGKYCLFLNSGDWLVNNLVLENILREELLHDFVYSRQMIFENGSIKMDAGLDLEYISFRSLKKASLPHQSMLIKSILFEKIGLYNENNKIISDWEFVMLGLFKYNCSIRQINIPISVYDKNGISSSKDTFQLQQEERSRFLEKNFQYILIDYNEFENFMNKKYIRLLLIIKKILNKAKSQFIN